MNTKFVKEVYNNSICQRTTIIINSAQGGASLITKQGEVKNSLTRYLIPLQLWQLETLFGDGIMTS